MKQVKWKFDRLYNASAQKVAEEIGDEETTPEKVLEKAKDEKSELHKCFEWNDSVAAEKYRLEQARCIIRNLVYVPAKEDDPPVRYYSITQERHVYQPTKFFIQQVDEHEKLLKRALEELRAFKQKYKTLSELESVLGAIEEVL